MVLQMSFDVVLHVIEKRFCVNETNLPPFYCHNLFLFSSDLLCLHYKVEVIHEKFVNTYDSVVLMWAVFASSFFPSDTDGLVNSWYFAALGRSHGMALESSRVLIHRVFFLYPLP